MYVGKPIPVPQLDDKALSDDKALGAAVDALHKIYLVELQALFTEYKAHAGFGNWKLEFV